MKDVEILCPFCSAPQALNVEVAIFGVSSGCDTCGYGAGANGEVNVHCSKCERLIYTKEFEED